MKKPAIIIGLAVLAIGSLLFGLLWEEQTDIPKKPAQEPKSSSSPPETTETTSPNGPWENITIDEENYVTVRSIQEFYGFETLTESGPKLILEKTNIRLEFLIGQQDVWMNKIKFIFSFPIKKYQEHHLIHRVDLVKLLDPVLRPAHINLGSIDTVIIDPGHGGHDPGTTSPHSHGTEKDHTLSLAKKLSTQLRKRGFKVGLTRSTDKYLTLQNRVDFANQYPNAVFISLHFNSGGGGRAQGIETFTLSPKGVAHYGRGLKASDFKEKPGNNNDAANIALATAIHSTVIKNTGRQDRGIRRARYSVITGVKHPAILLEGGYLSNRSEGAYIKRSDYQDRLAISIADAIVKYKMATTR